MRTGPFLPGVQPCCSRTSSRPAGFHVSRMSRIEGRSESRANSFMESRPLSAGSRSALCAAGKVRSCSGDASAWVALTLSDLPTEKLHPDTSHNGKSHTVYPKPGNSTPSRAHRHGGHLLIAGGAQKQPDLSATADPQFHFLVRFSGAHRTYRTGSLGDPVPGNALRARTVGAALVECPALVDHRPRSSAAGAGFRMGHAGIALLLTG